MSRFSCEIVGLKRDPNSLSTLALQNSLLLIGTTLITGAVEDTVGWEPTNSSDHLILRRVYARAHLRHREVRCSLTRSQAFATITPATQKGTEAS